MANTSARRLGIEVDDLELEHRLRRMEVELQKRQLANFQTVESSQRRTRSDVPRVIGIRLDNSIVGGLAVRWNSVDQPDIQRYEIQIDATNAFRDPDTFKTNEPVFIFPNLQSGLEFFVRVRAINNRGFEGDWSGVLNTSTGQATFLDLQSGAAGNIITSTITSGFNPATISFGVSGEYGTITSSLPTTTEVLIFGFVKADYSITQNDSIVIDVVVDGQVKQQYEQINTTSLVSPLSGRMTVPGLGFPQVLGQGQHRYSFVVSATGTTTVTPLEVTLAIWEQRR
jgi:hypothetical protein